MSHLTDLFPNIPDVDKHQESAKAITVPQSCVDEAIAYSNKLAELGYQARYAEYKSSYDKVCGEFTSHGDLKDWTIPRSFWALNTPVDRLRVNPALFNSVVALQYDGSQPTDPFLCRFAFNCKMVRDMSVNGLPII